MMKVTGRMLAAHSRCEPICLQGCYEHHLAGISGYPRPAIISGSVEGSRTSELCIPVLFVWFFGLDQ